MVQETGPSGSAAEAAKVRGSKTKRKAKGAGAAQT